MSTTGYLVLVYLCVISHGGLLARLAPTPPYRQSKKTDEELPGGEHAGHRGLLRGQARHVLGLRTGDRAFASQGVETRRCQNVGTRMPKGYRRHVKV